MNANEYNDYLKIRTNQIRDEYTRHEATNEELRGLLAILKLGDRQLNHGERLLVQTMKDDSEKTIKQLREEYLESVWTEHHQGKDKEFVKLFGVKDTNELTVALESSLRHHLGIYVRTCKNTLCIIEEMKLTVVEREFIVSHGGV